MTNSLLAADEAHTFIKRINMNINQIKTAIAKFKNADVSIIKDDALRAKAQKLQAKQKGFTLLELLIVVTLLATLATAALVAYDGIGENARDAAAATNITTLENTLRSYRAVIGEYPEQFDNLANADGDTTDFDTITTGAMALLPIETKAFFGQITFAAANTDGTNATVSAIFNSLANAGLEELQSVTSTTAWDAGYIPNLAMNESYPLTNTDPGSEIEFEGGEAEYAENGIVATLALSIVPSGGDAGACAVTGAGAGDLLESFNGEAVTNNARLNLISDGLGSDTCDLVIALGVGKEVPGATLGRSIELAQAPTVGTNNVNPKTHYARAIALFQVGTDSDESGVIDDSEIFQQARLIGLVDPEGRTIDEIHAAAISNDVGED